MTEHGENLRSVLPYAMIPVGNGTIAEFRFALFVRSEIKPPVPSGP